jgi:Cys-rich protein (TIGR01571 family)
VIVTKFLATTTLATAAVVGATSITVASTSGFVSLLKVGSDITIDLGSTAGLEEPGQVKTFIAISIGRRLGGSTTLTLQNALTKNHSAGAVIAIQEQSIWEQIKKQSSSGSLDSLRSSASSAGSIDSSESYKSLESGSLKNDILGTFTTAAWAEITGASLGNLLLMLCFAVIYKQKAVDPVGILPEQGRQYDSGEDFQYGVCECWKDAHMCCMVLCCSSVRIAHTNAVTDVCGFWETLLGLCCTSLICGPIGPCCLNVWFRIHLKDHMGLEDHCLNDMLLTWCCFPCMVGQQALSVDEKMGYVFRCPCTMERGGSGFGGYGETQALYG